MSEAVEIVEETIASVVEEVVTVVEVAMQGPPGVGSGSGGGTSYAHTQAISASTWDVAHGLGFKPAGHQLWDSAGTEWTGFRVIHVDNNNLRILIDFSFAGSSLHS
jgi:hypothetical protein